MSTVLFFGVVLVFLGLVWFSLRAQGRRRESWKSFAAARQLGYDGKNIAGVISGFTVAVLVESRGQGRSRHDVAVVRCSLQGALPPAFSLSKETLADKVMHLLNRHDHQLGFPELDAAFHLGHVDDQARRVLGDRRAQQVLLATVASYPAMRIGNGSLQLELSYVPDTEEKLQTLLTDAISVAQGLRRANSSD